MPQLDIDLLEDFLFFAFAALLLGFGDEDSEENVIESSSDAYLAQYYLSKQKSLIMETSHVSTSSIFAKLYIFNQLDYRLFYGISYIDFILIFALTFLNESQRYWYPIPNLW